MLEEFDRDKFLGLYVVVKQSGDKDINLENALNKLKKKVKDSNLLVELQERSSYKKPSSVRRDIKNRAKARNKSHGKT